MRTLICSLGLVLAGWWLLPGFLRAADQPGEDKVELQLATYQELAERIRGLKGKVVVVDFWADFCVPCKREFPHLVELYRKYRDRGLAAVSVSLDDPKKESSREKALKFLRAQNATFTNILLNEPAEVWQQKLGVAGPPVVFVFNREGKIAQRYPVKNAQGEEQPVDYREIEKLVVELLGKK